MGGVAITEVVGAFTATTGIGQANCCAAGAAGAAGVAAIGAVLLAEGGRCIFCKAGDAAGVEPL